MNMSNCIVFLNYLNYTFIFIWTMYFYVLELYIEKKFIYDFTIRVYITFFILCQKCIFDNLGYNPFINNKSVYTLFKELSKFKNPYASLLI
jgi:hypothetical protein